MNPPGGSLLLVFVVEVIHIMASRLLDKGGKTRGGEVLSIDGAAFILQHTQPMNIYTHAQTCNCN